MLTALCNHNRKRLEKAVNSIRNFDGKRGRMSQILRMPLFYNFLSSGLGASKPTFVGRSVCLSVCLSVEKKSKHVGFEALSENKISWTI